jgi:hypothetical protein
MQEARDLRKEMNLEVGTDAEKKNFSLLKRISIIGVLLLLSFLLGLISSWLSERETLRQRDAAQANLRLSQLQNRLATAAINARRGEYEPARVATSDFFTDLRAEIDRQESAFDIRQREAVQPVLDERDELITLLARYDQAAAERLTDLYLHYVQAVNPAAQKPQ